MDAKCLNRNSSLYSWITLTGLVHGAREEKPIIPNTGTRSDRKDLFLQGNAKFSLLGRLLLSRSYLRGQCRWCPVQLRRSSMASGGGSSWSGSRGAYPFFSSERTTCPSVRSSPSGSSSPGEWACHFPWSSISPQTVIECSPGFTQRGSSPPNSFPSRCIAEAFGLGRNPASSNSRWTGSRSTPSCKRYLRGSRVASQKFPRAPCTPSVGWNARWTRPPAPSIEAVPEWRTCTVQLLALSSLDDEATSVLGGRRG